MTGSPQPGKAHEASDTARQTDGQHGMHAKAGSKAPCLVPLHCDGEDSVVPSLWPCRHWRCPCTAAATVPNPQGHWFPIRHIPPLRMRRCWRRKASSLCTEGVSRVLAGTATWHCSTAGPASSCPSPIQQQIYGAWVEAAKGTRRSVSDAAARSCNRRAQERSPHCKSQGAADKIKQKVCHRRAEGGNKARHGAASHTATFPAPGRRASPPA